MGDHAAAGELDLDTTAEAATESPGRSSLSPPAAEAEEPKPPAGMMKAPRDRWNNRFELLRAFQREHGHCAVPRNYEVGSVKLGKWVDNQRRLYKHRPSLEDAGSCEAAKHIAQLNGVGFQWESIEAKLTKDKSWEQMFQLLCEFKTNKGHCRVPQNFIVDSVKLGEWVRQQRVCYKYRMAGKTGKGASISDKRIAQLNEIGFDWKLRNQAPDRQLWSSNYQLLCEFQNEHGHCRVPQRLTFKSVKLGAWVKDQRNLYKKHMEGQRGHAASITEERIAQLNAIGFEWKVIYKCKPSIR